ncbi:MAG: thiol peroxidase [Candidatus Cybelea sp.]|jgi:thiol peroxidase
MTTDNVQERAGVVTFKGQPMTLLGPALRRGDPAPSFALTSGDLSTVTPEILLDEGKRAALLIVVPSLDTSVCSLESKKFNQRLGELPEGVKAAVVSMDLPFAQARWCAAEGDVQLDMLSDYRNRNFGTNYGLLIAELGLLARAIVVIGKDAMVSYVEIVPEVANEPDYDAALHAAAAAAAA